MSFAGSRPIVVTGLPRGMRSSLLSRWADQLDDGRGERRVSPGGGLGDQHHDHGPALAELQLGAFVNGDRLGDLLTVDERAEGRAHVNEHPPPVAASQFGVAARDPVRLIERDVTL